MNIYKYLGRKIKNLRKEKGLSLEEFAQKLNISTKYMDKIEKGKSEIYLDELFVICEIFQTEPQVIFKDFK